MVPARLGILNKAKCAFPMRMPSPLSQGSARVRLAGISKAISVLQVTSTPKSSFLGVVRVPLAITSKVAIAFRTKKATELLMPVDSARRGEAFGGLGR